MIDIWREAGRPDARQSIAGAGYRLVESQEAVATTAIVSSLESQAILEELLDAASKPRYPPRTTTLHYLLATPFRYPPLAHGSRFGGRFEPSLFYGGTSEHVTLCEAAYYRAYFYRDMTSPPLHGRLQTQHTLFGFRYASGDGIRLQDPPFDAFRDVLRSPTDYAATQALGKTMRSAGVTAFEYRSARDSDAGINVALFDPSAFAADGPTGTRSCLCETAAHAVVFSLDGRIVEFPVEQFLMDDVFPTPAP